MIIVKKVFLLTFIFILIFSVSSYAMPEMLPEDIGSSAELIDILNPTEEEIINYSETYLISCMAEPDTEITLYTRLVDEFFIPMVIDDEAITGIVGESGMFAIDVTFEPNSTNEIMFYAEKDGEYQTMFRTIIIQDEEEKEVKKKHKVLNLRDLVNSVLK